MIVEWRVVFRGLVHDVHDYQESTDGVETGCGFILPSKDKVSYEPTSCLVCISDNVHYERMLNALKELRAGAQLQDAFVYGLKKGGLLR